LQPKSFAGLSSGVDAILLTIFSRASHQASGLPVHHRDHFNPTVEPFQKAFRAETETASASRRKLSRKELVPNMMLQKAARAVFYLRTKAEICGRQRCWMPFWVVQQGGPFLCFFLVFPLMILELLVSGIFFVTGMAATNMFRGA